MRSLEWHRSIKLLASEYSEIAQSKFYNSPIQAVFSKCRPWAPDIVA